MPTSKGIFADGSTANTVLTVAKRHAIMVAIAVPINIPMRSTFTHRAFYNIVVCGAKQIALTRAATYRYNSQ